MVVKENACSESFCDDPENEGCNRGNLLADCKFYRKGTRRTKANSIKSSEDDSADPDDRSLRLPWTGNTLGLRDLERIVTVTMPKLIGVVGPFNSGKTTLLSLMYLLLERGQALKVGAFAGSASLAGWGNIAANLRWKASEGGPTFPPHTSRSAGRRPGMLHLSVRRPCGSRSDFLLTDPPGEWFSTWAQQENADGAEGARWIGQRADRFLFLVDREALASPNRGKARDDLRDLARRLASVLNDRPVAVVWTKSDQEIRPVIEEDLQDCFRDVFPEHVEFRLQMRFGNEPKSAVEEPCLELINWTLSEPIYLPSASFVLPVSDTNAEDFLLSFRGRGGKR